MYFLYVAMHLIVPGLHVFVCVCACMHMCVFENKR